MKRLQRNWKGQVHDLKMVIFCGLVKVLASMIYLGSDIFEWIIGALWMIGAIVFYKQILRLVCEAFRFVWTVMGKIWDYIMRL